MNSSNSIPKMAEFPVILDSCVLFPMYLRDLILCTAEAELYLPYWSQEILNGATRNLVSQGRMTAELAMKLEKNFRFDCKYFGLSYPFYLVKNLTCQISFNLFSQLITTFGRFLEARKAIDFCS